MPEIKNSFSKATMNKDLDERVVPNGQFRDAMNIQISTSEGSAVGTAQNILGNTMVEQIVSGFGYKKMKCIGGITDEKNNVLYWFVTSDDTDAIIEHHDDGTTTPILVDKNAGTVDAVLKFEYNNIITGINIIDDLLFWTDNVNEPRKVNIKRLKLNNHVDLNTHSSVFPDGPGSWMTPITEDHITVIKKRPNSAPEIIFKDTLIEPVIQTLSEEDEWLSFTDSNGSLLNPTQSADIFMSMDGSYPATELISDFTYNRWVQGDTLLLSRITTPGNLPQNYEVKGVVTSKTQIATANYTNAAKYKITIKEISGNVTAAAGEWKVTKQIDDDPIFEKEFIRFATRWKYEDGEYSAFSPFTQPIFLAGSFGFSPTKDPYNVGMSNKLVTLTLNNLITPVIPSDVVQVDILFKKDRSTTVYSVDSIKKKDKPISGETYNIWNQPNKGKYWQLNPYLNTWPADTIGTGLAVEDYGPYHGSYDITTENIYAALPANQILRPWDNVPRKALAQEITANRVIYANYLQNYDLKDPYGEDLIISPVIDFEKNQLSDFTTGEKSIKSERTYHLGVVYGDRYGRETPILTGTKSSIKIPFDLNLGPGFDGAASNSLRLVCKLRGDSPSWAEYYKYFIKQTTGEYYNLTMDRVYKADGDDNLWLSFPSSDRNKLQEGDYFTIKKQIDIDSQVPVKNKIKVIDIKSSAPKGIKYKYTLLGQGGGSQGDLNNLFPDANARPAPNVKRISIDRETWIETEFGMDLDSLTPSDRMALQFQINQGGNVFKSKKYIASAWFREDAGEDGRYNFLLEETIHANDDWVESEVGVLNSDDGLMLTIFKIDEINAREFEGRFFVKIISDTVTQQYLVPSGEDNVDNYQIVARAYVFEHTDNMQTSNPITTPANIGLYSNMNVPEWQTPDHISGSSQANSENDWRLITKWNTDNDNNMGWFIDSSYFASAQESGGSYVTNPLNDSWDANKSGRMMKGWIGDGGNNGGNPNWFVNSMPGIIDVNNSNQFHYNAQGDPSGMRHWSKRHFKFMPDHFPQTLSQINYAGNGGYSEKYWGDETTSATKYTGGTYQVSPGDAGVFMHLSWSTCGVDLHDGDFEGWPDDTDDGANMDDWLQWITASGIYFAHHGGDFNDNVDPNQGNVEIDAGYGHNFTQFNANVTSVGLEANERQFDPTYMGGATAGGVISQLKPGSRFKFVGDPETTYTIKSVDVKYLYNHTPWNPVLKLDANGNIGPGTGANHNPSGPTTNGASVAEALHGYCVQGNWSHAQLKQKIVDFGKANNRRVCYIIQLDKDPRFDSVIGYNPLSTTSPSEYQAIRFIDTHIEAGTNTLPKSPAIFETEAKEDIDLNIYYEASDALPVKLPFNSEDARPGHMLAPVGSRVVCNKNNSLVDYDSINTDWKDIGAVTLSNVTSDNVPFDFFLRVADWEGDTVTLDNPGLRLDGANDLNTQTSAYANKLLTFFKPDGSYTEAEILKVTEITGLYITKLQLYIHDNPATRLPYYNCFSFGNGVESNRVRDDFNESYILNGVKASTILEAPYEEERRKYGLIYSGLYNSTSGVNNLNQFIQAEKITKDVMPIYGSIQKLYARDKDLVTLCEDKILRIYVDKDVLYNADGNTQLLATNRVLGEAQPFSGEYGISQNPESFASESFRAYFTDKQRGAVIRLSKDGITPISEAGMHDFFRDSLKDGGRLYGSYDLYKKDYNLSILYSDGENIIKNPGFEKGGSRNVGLGSELLSNESFSDPLVTTLGEEQLQIGDFSDKVVSHLYWHRWNGNGITNNYPVLHNDYTLYHQGINTPTNIPKSNINGVITHSSGYVNSNANGGGMFWGPNTQFDAFGVPNLGVGTDDPLAPALGTHISQTFDTSNPPSGSQPDPQFYMVAGKTATVKFDIHHLSVPSGFKSDFMNGECKMFLTLLNPYGDGGRVDENTFKFHLIPKSAWGAWSWGKDKMHCEFDIPLQIDYCNTPGYPGPTPDPNQWDTPSGVFTDWKLHIGVIGGEDKWKGIQFHLDNISITYETISTPDWLLGFEAIPGVQGQNTGPGTLELTHPTGTLNMAYQTLSPGTIGQFNDLGIANTYQAEIVVTQVDEPGVIDISVGGDHNTDLYVDTPGTKTLYGLSCGNDNSFGMISMSGEFHIASASLKGEVPYGGLVTDWDLGSDPGMLYYDEYEWTVNSLVTLRKIITFKDAVANVGMTQTSPEIEAMVVDDTYRVSFKISNWDGDPTASLTLKLFNSDGDGFEVEGIKENGNYSFIKDIDIVGNNAYQGKIAFVVGVGDYNGTIDDITLERVGGGETLTYSEDVRGWTSFKSFIPEFGLSVVNQYYTMNFGRLFKHHTNETRNTFYDEFEESSITPILNRNPGVVKNFNTLNYEGSQSRVQELREVEVPGLVPSENIFFNSDLSQGDNFNGIQLSSFTSNAWGTTLPVTLLESAAPYNPILFNDPATFSVNNGQIEINNLSIGGSYGTNGQFTFGSDLDVIEIHLNPAVDNALHSVLTSSNVFAIGKEYILTFDYSCEPVDYPDAMGYDVTTGFPTFSYGVYVDSPVHDSGVLNNSGTYTTTFPVTTGTGGGTGVKLSFGNSGLTTNNYFPVNVSIDNISIQVMVSDTINDGEYYNLYEKPGWYVYDIHTDKQAGTLVEFIEKEGKWFNYIRGRVGREDTAALNFQGLGIIQNIT